MEKVKVPIDGVTRYFVETYVPAPVQQTYTTWPSPLPQVYPQFAKVYHYYSTSDLSSTCDRSKSLQPSTNMQSSSSSKASSNKMRPITLEQVLRRTPPGQQVSVHPLKCPDPPAQMTLDKVFSMQPLTAPTSKGSKVTLEQVLSRVSPGAQFSMTIQRPGAAVFTTHMEDLNAAGEAPANCEIIYSRPSSSSTPPPPLPQESPGFWSEAMSQLYDRACSSLSRLCSVSCCPCFDIIVGHKNIY